MSFVTDCDYCGEISLCFNDNIGGTCCHDCGNPKTGDPCPDEDYDRPAIHPIFDGEYRMKTRQEQIEEMLLDLNDVVQEARHHNDSEIDSILSIV